VTTELRMNYYKANVKVGQQDASTGKADVECFDVIDALGLDFYTGNVLKYLWRAGKKSPNSLEDLKKALTYLNQAIAREEVKPAVVPIAMRG